MKRYTILSFNFGGYDKLREPKKYDPEAEYVFVTDRPADSRVWNVRVDARLAAMNPLAASYYVRWHPFEFASTPVVIVMDASIQVNDSLRDVYGEFEASGADFGPMVSNFDSDEQKIHYWLEEFKRMAPEDGERLRRFIARIGMPGQKGSVCNACMLWRDTAEARRYQRHTWRLLMALGRDGMPNRQDEVVSHKALAMDRGRVKVFPMTIQLIHSTYLSYCQHGKDVRHPDRADFDQDFWLCGEPVHGARFSKAIPYPRKYAYRTEAVLLTRFASEDDLREWLNWHLYRAGFDRVMVFDNSPDGLKAVCDEYDEVSYMRVEGNVRQYRLYDSYVNWQSGAEWVMPIDDDEFLDVGGFASIGDALEHYGKGDPHLMAMAVRWKHLFPVSFREERETDVLHYCKVENPQLATTFNRVGDMGVKCIVRRYGSIHWEETWENFAGGHVPKMTCSRGAVMCDGTPVGGCQVPAGYAPAEEPLRLIHCRYTGPSDWARKRHGVRVSDAMPHGKNYDFDGILPYLA